MNTHATPNLSPALCRAALQADLDTYGSVSVPGWDKSLGPIVAQRFRIDRPLFMDSEDVGLESDGTGEITNTRNSGVLILGIKRKPFSADHYPVGGGFRTCGDSRIVFQSSPFSKLSPQMTITCQVTANKGWGSDQTPLFGSMYNGQPGPWYAMVVNGGTVFAFLFKTADGVVHVAEAPISSASFKAVVNLDLIAGTVDIQIS